MPAKTKPNHGGSSQERRRARRAILRGSMNRQARAAAEAADYAEIEALIASTEEAPDAALAVMASCAECSHPAGMHADTGDGDNMGSCSAEGCDCGGYMPEGAAITGDVVVAGAPVGRLTVGEEAVHAAVLALLQSSVFESPEGVEEAARETVERFRLEFDSFVQTFATRSAANAVTTFTDLPVELTPTETLPPPNASPSAPEAGVTGPAELRWTATIVPEGVRTDDRRAIAPGALTWRELPLTLGAMLDTPHADVVTESPACGRIDEIWRSDDGVLRARGAFDAGDFGQEIGRMVADGTLRGVSVDLAVHEYEIGPASQWFDADGVWLPEKPETADAEEPDLLDLLFGEAEDTIFVITSATIGAVTICPFQAFAEARISVGDSLVAAGTPGIWTSTMQGGFAVVSRPTALLASAADGDGDGPEPPSPSLLASAAGLAPVQPPADWFADPALRELTPLTVTEDGRVFGHAWAWGTCHIGVQNGCTTAPHSLTGYAYFHVGELECDGGERVSVGHLTFDTGHAGQRLSRTAASAHYDDTGKVGAYVRVGEDEFGGWVAGTLSPTVSVEDAQRLRGAAPSGDWRAVDGNLELVALLAVNVPGFPVPRPAALVAAGAEGEQVLALVAAGQFDENTVPPPVEEVEAVRSLALTADIEFRADRALQS